MLCIDGEAGNIHNGDFINDTETYKHCWALFTQQGKSINAHLNCCIWGGGGKCTELLVPVFVEAIIHSKISDDNVIDIMTMTCPKYTSRKEERITDKAKKGFTQLTDFQFIKMKF